ncbi:hypothetical protein [Anseongella ginsenosidimutans]|nr:hypothetical protein [Anseongella ginsenosidimutans]QEC52637.1 hypothetical protein FRZ59_10000 [Anseongella ginsenosidimutans]
MNMTYEETIAPFRFFPSRLCVEDVNERNEYHQRDDRLWKAALEDLFEDFLRFFFPAACESFDFGRGFSYLDKEFDQLLSPEESDTGVRHVDKLVKVYLKDNTEKCFLTHIEVQGQRGREEFTKRMHRYWYRVKDKYRIPVTSLAILTDNNKSFRPGIYTEECLGTSLIYKFNSYKILDQDEEMLRANSNPFALIILTTLLYIKNKNQGGYELLNMKRDLLKEMLGRNLDKIRQRAVFNFLNHFVHFRDEEIKSIFEQDIKELTKRNIAMGTEEYLLDKAMSQGIEKGIEKGVEKGLRQGKERFVRNLILQLDLNDRQAAGVAEVSVEFVKHVRQSLFKSKKATSIKE